MKCRRWRLAYFNKRLGLQKEGEGMRGRGRNGMPDQRFQMKIGTILPFLNRFKSLLF